MANQIYSPYVRVADSNGNRLTLQRLHEVLKYDAKTGVFTWKKTLAHRAPAGSVAGSTSGNGYRHITVEGGRFLAHRLAWFYTHGTWPMDCLDHINGQPSDNRIVNLREASMSQNLANISAHKDSSTGLKGVTKKRDKWQARIFCRGKNHVLGCFGTPQEARAAYLSAASRLFGEFARAA